MAMVSGPVRCAQRGVSVSRGLALFVGAYSILDGLGAALGARGAGALWLIDLRGASAWMGPALGALAGALLVGFAIKPDAPKPRRLITTLVAAALALAACRDAVAFYGAWRTGAVAPAVPVPFSLFMAAVLAWIARHAWTALPARRAESLAAIAVAVAAAITFPLAQIAFFGTTDYRRPADAAVVFGAKAYASGALSTSLEDRVRTAVDLHRAGLVRVLVMSGAVGASGVDETVAMRDRAIELGVPADAVLRDPGGKDTESTVAGTVPLLAAQGLTRVLAVSQFYHLPRIKMAYRAAGVDVQTVPATALRYIPETPALVLREVAGFWAYWARDIGRAWLAGPEPP